MKYDDAALGQEVTALIGRQKRKIGRITELNSTTRKARVHWRFPFRKAFTWIKVKALTKYDYLK